MTIVDILGGMQLFLDANAHLPLSKKAVQAFVEFNNSFAGHGHAMSPSRPGRAAQNAIEESRGKIAQLLGAKQSNQIVFTSTCTQACEWAIEILSKLQPKKTFMSPAEHPAIRQAAQILQPELMDIDKDGVIINSKFDGCTICIHTQNETGVIQPIENIKSDFLFCDFSQTPGKANINLSSIDVDMAVFGGHKFGGSSGVGFMYIKDINIWKDFGTGSRYYLDRPGTPDAAAIVATAAALEEATETISERINNMTEFRNVVESGLQDLNFDIVSFNAKRIPNTTLVSMPNGLGFKIMNALAEHNIYVGLGSACGSSYSGPNPLMKALGRTGGPHDYVRISQFGEYASKEAQLFLEKLQKCIV